MIDFKDTDKMLPQIIDLILRLAAVLVLLIWSFQIIMPFIIPVVWGGVLAIAVFPGYKFLEERLGGRSKLAAILVSSLLLIIIVIPSWFFADSLVSGVTAIREMWDQGTFSIPPPTERVKDWAIVGQQIFDIWTLASENLAEALAPLSPQLKYLATWLLGALAQGGFAVLQFVFSIVIAGVMLASSKRSGHVVELFFERLSSERGREFVADAEITVRNVARGILGVAFIQAVLSGVGFAAAGIPGAGLWAFVCLILGIIQVGVGPVLIVACIYLFSNASSLTAGLFLAWSLMVMTSDNILKPLLLGKGAPVPMLVIFLGALGGFLRMGIIGLFLGAVVLSLVYKLLVSWLERQSNTKA